MRAVNLIPDSAGRGGRAEALAFQPMRSSPCWRAALVLVTVYVLTNNTIAERKAKVGTLQEQAAQAKANAVSLNIRPNSSSSPRSASKQSVRSPRPASTGTRRCRTSRRSFPPNTSLQSLTATVAPGVRPGGGAGTGSPRAAQRRRRAGVRDYRLHEDPGRRRAADVTPAADQRCHAGDAGGLGARQKRSPAGSRSSALGSSASHRIPGLRTATRRASTSSCSSRPLPGRARHRTPPPRAPAGPRHARTTTTTSTGTTATTATPPAATTSSATSSGSSR